MGLNVSYDAWNGSYSSFNNFRKELCRVAGVDWDSIDDRYEWCNYLGMWKETPSDPLLVLLVHSDCDGYIFPAQMEQLANRLIELKPLVDEDWQESVQDFIDALWASLDDSVIMTFG